MTAFGEPRNESGEGTARVKKCADGGDGGDGGGGGGGGLGVPPPTWEDFKSIWTREEGEHYSGEPGAGLGAGL